MADVLFTPLRLRNVTLPNRLVRSATYEGWGDPQGVPRAGLTDMYLELARGGVGTIVSGFVFTEWQGRAMHPGQCGMDDDAKVEPWRKVIGPVLERHPETRLFMQIAHTGRQTLRRVTGLPVVGASPRKCTYFRQRVSELDAAAIARIASGFGDAALRAKEAGFHGVQVHAAHGYLIHQFLSPWTNTRKDRWADRPLFLEEVVRAVQERCGPDYPVLVKLSCADDRGLTLADTRSIVRRLEALGVDAVEISYGTMEYALNIIRGACPVDVVLEVNPLFNRIPRLLRVLWKLCLKESYLRNFLAFQENYNRDAAVTIKRDTRLPVITVGGLRTAKAIRESVERYGLDAVALCRPLLCEPDLPNRLQAGEFVKSRCTNCNLCTIHCDGPEPTFCRTRKERHGRAEDV